MEKIINPFLIKGYAGKELFCDREQELDILYKNVCNGVDTTLISPRRIGKTGLILRFFDYLKEKAWGECVYVDIYASRNLEDLVRLLAEAILLKFPEKTNIGKRFMTFLKGLRPLIGYDALTGEPQVQIVYQMAQEKENTLKGVLDFLDSQNVNIVLAIDEFQQITEYPEQNMEALLRTYIQQLKNIRFIFSGSQRAMMLEIFSNANRPFFASTQYLSIEKIQQDVYATFITDLFERYGKQIDPNCVAEILNWSRRHTFYTQSLCNRIFAMGTSHVTTEQVKWACSDLLERNEPVFLQYRQLLTPIQWNFLIAIAKEHEVKQISAQHFISKYGIGSPANARRLAKAMIEKELVLETVDKTGVTYQVYDVFFSRWLEREY